MPRAPRRAFTDPGAALSKSGRLARPVSRARSWFSALGAENFTTGRGVEALGSCWSFLDLTPFGRQETWEDSPAGYPQTPPYAWWRLHDEYDDTGRAG